MSVDADRAITNRKELQSAITGCYDALQLTGYYGRDYLLVADLTADNLKWTGTTVDYKQFEDNGLNAANTIVTAIWRDIYDAINRINYTLSKVDNVAQVTPEEALEYKGELAFLRGLCYFDLVRVFGGVPVRTSPTLSVSDIRLARSTTAETYERAINDLRYALQYIGVNTTVPVKASRYAAKALLARVYLHRYALSQNTADLDSAIVESTEVIESGAFQMAKTFGELFPANKNKESIFELAFNAQDMNRLAQYLLPGSLFGRKELSPTENIDSAYTGADARKSVTIRRDGTALYCGKYLDVAGGTDHIYIIRLAEMFLIRAEANNLLNRPASEILPDIEVVRQRAGLTTPLTASTQDEIALVIEQERRLEFAFEGHRWHDLTRTDRAIVVKNTINSRNQYLFPIPLNEILYNTAFGSQNPDY
jgi:hypothetical protein